MNVEKNKQDSKMELLVTLPWSEFEPYIKQGTEQLAKDVKIPGFREGKAPYDVLKQQVGEMAILEAAAKICVNKTAGKVMAEHLEGVQGVGQPRVDITQMAPNNDLKYKVEVDLLPEIKLGKYKELGIVQEKAEVADEEVNKVLDQLRENQVKEALVERPVQQGDKVMADIKMFQDKVPLEGGQSQNTTIIVGKDYIIPGFDKNLVGAKKGDKLEFELVYPEDHHQQNLSGKKVEFVVEVKEIYERALPEVDDDFAKNFQMPSKDELLKNIKESMKQEKETKARQKAESELLSKLIKETDFGNIPESLVDHELDAMMREIEQNITMQGGKFEDYLQSINKTKESLRDEFRDSAVKRVKSSLIVREIAEKEEIRASLDDINKEIEHLKEHYKDEAAQQQIDSEEFRKHLANQIANQKTMEKLREWNITKK